MPSLTSRNAARGPSLKTGTLTQLQRVWDSYGIYVAHMASGTSLMRDLVFVIDKTGP
jgi:hypothetical protein